jgi:hypothetical protein
MAAVPASNSWQETAAYYESLYADGPSPEFLAARRQFAVEALTMLQRAAGAAADGVPRVERSEIDISSLDSADDFISPVHFGKRRPGQEIGLGVDVDRTRAVLRVESIGLGVECLTMESFLFFWMFEGRLGFNLAYNEAFYTKDLMRSMLDTVIHVLTSELRVHMS